MKKSELFDLDKPIIEIIPNNECDKEKAKIVQDFWNYLTKTGQMLLEIMKLLDELKKDYENVK